MQEYITNGRHVFRAILETWKFCPNTKIHLIILFYQTNVTNGNTNLKIKLHGTIQPKDVQI